MGGKSSKENRQIKMKILSRFIYFSCHGSPYMILIDSLDHQIEVKVIYIDWSLRSFFIARLRVELLLHR